MKNDKFYLKKIAVLTILAIFFGGFFGNFSESAAQETQRERIVVKPTPTPLPSPTIAPVFNQAIADLQTKIRLVLARPELRRGQIGIKIVSLNSNKTVFEENAEKYFMPASNMKSYTLAAAIENLSPDFRFITSVYALTKPDANGTIKGDLTIYGRGDVSLSNSFYNGDYYQGLNLLAEKIVQSGVKKIEGNLVGDESYLTGNPLAAGWEWDDLQWDYGAEVSALSVNDNVVDLAVRPAAVNAPCAVQILPVNSIMKIVNRCTTAVRDTKRNLQVEKKLDQNILEISGTMPIGDAGFKGGIAVSRPAALFVEMLRGILIQKGITIIGQNKTLNAKEKSMLNVAAIPPIEIARLESPPLSIIAAKTLKPSQNLYTETILRTLGEQVGAKQNFLTAGDDTNKVQTKPESAELGLQAVGNFLLQAGIGGDSVLQYDGSGLSRHNLVTPASAAQLFAYMSKSRYAAAWRDALTVGAVDGTLRNRFRGTSAANNVRGKTGTIDQVSSLSGYVTTTTGERLAFGIFVNGVGSVKLRQAIIDEIVVDLSDFRGKID